MDELLSYLDGVNARLITDQSVAFLELRSGNLDSFPEMDLKDVATARTNPDLVVEKIPGAWHEDRADGFPVGAARSGDTIRARPAWTMTIVMRYNTATQRHRLTRHRLAPSACLGGRVQCRTRVARAGRPRSEFSVRRTASTASQALVVETQPG